MKMALQGFRVALGAALVVPLSALAAELDLAGEWTLTQADKPSVTCPVAVPGGMYTALYDAKLIPDPYFAQNEKLIYTIAIISSPSGNSEKTAVDSSPQ